MPRELHVQPGTHNRAPLPHRQAAARLQIRLDLGAQPRRQQPCWRGVQQNCVLLLIKLHVQTQERAATVRPRSQHRLQALQPRGTSPLSTTMHRRTSHQTMIHIPDMPAQGLRAPVYVWRHRAGTQRVHIQRCTARQLQACWGYTISTPLCCTPTPAAPENAHHWLRPLTYAACQLLPPTALPPACRSLRALGGYVTHPSSPPEPATHNPHQAAHPPAPFNPPASHCATTPAHTSSGEWQHHAHHSAAGCVNMSGGRHRTAMQTSNQLQQVLTHSTAEAPPP
jgi:hypothetical protein